MTAMMKPRTPNMHAQALREKQFQGKVVPPRKRFPPEDAAEWWDYDPSPIADDAEQPRQPRLKRFGAEYYGRATTTTGDVWWHEERNSDGSIHRTALLPVAPIANTMDREGRASE